MKKHLVSFATMALLLSGAAAADPCGMVPPIWTGQGPPLVRVGVQRTFAFHHDGIEDVVLRPAFSGRVDEFGMLIPFPSPPAVRKVPEAVFEHVAAAIDPPEVVVDLRMQPWACFDGAAPGRPEALRALGYAGEPKEEQVVVLSEEAVGMYQVAVLDAGSAAALARWMDEHGFRYPEGMEETCDEYVDAGWCFVAVKARVGRKAGADPRPGMREVDTALPEGGGFEGHVQAMGFRFATDELVVPMRLSAHNPGPLHNVVYVLTDGPRRIDRIPPELVVRQLSGTELYRNLTEPLPLRVIGGGLDEIPEWRLSNLPDERDPARHNGIARELFAGDLLAAASGRLAHAHEEEEKELLAIGEELGLRGARVDELLHAALAEERERVLGDALVRLSRMTLTVVDGEFPREVLAADDLRFPAFAMAGEKNDERRWNARHDGPAPAAGGTLELRQPPSQHGLGARAFPVVAALGLVLLLRVASRRGESARRGAAVAVPALLGLLCLAPEARAERLDRLAVRCPERPACEVDRIGHWLAVAEEGEDLAERGRAIVNLAGQTGSDDAGRARAGLERLRASATEPLVRIWAGAALVRLCTDPDELAALSRRSAGEPALVRPLRTRWLELLAGEGEPDTEQLLVAAGTSHELRTALLPALLERGARELVAASLGAPDDTARSLAAGCLATLGQRDGSDVALHTLVALRFEPFARRVPWEGGALFVPSLPWTRGEARHLVGDLVAWYVWCERNGRSEDQRRLQIVLRSVGLARIAGYAPQGNGAEAWLTAWGRAAGRLEAERILAEQGIEDEPRWRAALAALAE